MNHTNLPTRLLWCDLEMTGLDPQTDVILELALAATDFKLDILGWYQASVFYDRGQLKRLIEDSDWLLGQSRSYQRDITNNCLKNGKQLATIEQEAITFCRDYLATENNIIIAGSSIHCDRQFIDRHLPKLSTKLHYRMLDVSAFKIYFQGRFGFDYQKVSRHRAIDDVKESIAELKHYVSKIVADHD